MTRSRALVALAVAGALALAACGDDDDSSTSATTSTSAASETTSTTASTPTTPGDSTVPLDRIRIKLTQVAELDQPLDLAWRKGDPNLYVAEKGGRIQRVAPDGSVTKVFDISDQVSNGNEQGLLGITFSPDGSKLYVHFTNTAGDTRVIEVAHDATSIAGGRTILEVDQPFPNHNGGRITFGPDDQLYLGLGDGGAGGDPYGNGQNPEALLGKILRIHPEDPSGPLRYAIGLRNPWRFSFDRETHDIWVGDVGQDAWEEIDKIEWGSEPGMNLGWNELEGTHPYEGGTAPAGALPPVYEYSHREGQSVVGGFVYRGTKIPDLRGVYLFADTYRGNLQALRVTRAGTQHADLGLTAPEGYVVSFGEDADGNLYVLSLNGGVYRIDPPGASDSGV